jgi:hypothetical protein
VTPRPLVGVSVQPGDRFWHHNRRLLEEQAELFEITPETMWRAGCGRGAGYAEMLARVTHCGRPVVGHGVLTSIGAASRPARRSQWLQALLRDRQAFGFQWFSEHLGFADAADMHVAWPLPLPPTKEDRGDGGDVAARAQSRARGRGLREQRRPVLPRRSLGAAGPVRGDLRGC